jgi:methylglutaconyl-CoA hydratase
MGERNMRRFALTGERIDVAEALRIGFVHQHCADLENGLAAIVDALLRGAPGAMRSLKASLREASPIATNATAVPALHHLMQSPEAIEGIASFREKRNPAWYPPNEGD